MISNEVVSAHAVSSIDTGSSWTMESDWAGHCGCRSLWSVSDAVVSDTGVVEALALMLPDAVSVVSREPVVLATDGIGFGSLTANELMDKPILWFSMFCGTPLE